MPEKRSSEREGSAVAMRGDSARAFVDREMPRSKGSSEEPVSMQDPATDRPDASRTQ
jgi:hypothetical protein